MFKTVRVRVAFLTVSFAIFAAALILALGLNLVGVYQRRFALQAAESNMRMAAQNIKSDFIGVSLLAYKLCEPGGDLSRYLTADYSVAKASAMVDDLSDAYLANRAGRYIDIIIVADAKKTDKFLYSGARRSGAFFSPAFVTEFMTRFPASDGFKIYGASESAFFGGGESSIDVCAPIYAPNNKTVAGKVYFAVNPNIIKDKLEFVATDVGSKFFLTLNGEVFSIGKGSFEKADGYADEPNAVTCEIRDGMSLTLMLPRSRIGAEFQFVLMILAVCALILALDYCVVVVMNRVVVSPIDKLHSAITKISQGEFSAVPEIESDSEIGEVGRGINKMALNLSGLIAARIADESERRELEYKMLQNQINPHFIYNALNTIRWMAKLQNSDDIAEISESLSRMLRTLSKDTRRVVTLREEFALLREYCVILRYRYGNTIEFDFSVENDELFNCLLPRFVLQPLVENAVFHGIEPRDGDIERGRVSVAAAASQGGVELTVRDNGVGMSEETIEKLTRFVDSSGVDDADASIGLINVHRRVRGLFGEPYGLSAVSEPGRFTLMTLLVPFTRSEGGTLNV